MPSSNVQDLSNNACMESIDTSCSALVLHETLSYRLSIPCTQCRNAYHDRRRRREIDHALYFQCCNWKISMWALLLTFCASHCGNRLTSSRDISHGVLEAAIRQEPGSSTFLRCSFGAHCTSCPCTFTNNVFICLINFMTTRLHLKVASRFAHWLIFFADQVTLSAAEDTLPWLLRLFLLVARTTSSFFLNFSIFCRLHRILSPCGSIELWPRCLPLRASLRLWRFSRGFLIRL